MPIRKSGSEKSVGNCESEKSQSFLFCVLCLDVINVLFSVFTTNRLLFYSVLFGLGTPFGTDLRYQHAKA